MIEHNKENKEFKLASDFIQYTNTSVFLTGKAGTGKTTFLRHIVQSNFKKSVVVAPTGVAAVNAGGTTIHSMFGLPTKSFVPSNERVDPNIANNQSMLSAHFKYHKEKLKVIREMELLVIDEVSMVRADLLDAIDFALRFTRRSNLPFGGVQVLFIGDMYQLPPVVKDEEWAILSAHYSSPYFFSSKVYASTQTVYIELKKIYRQSDNRFISILNNIREQEFFEDDFETLNGLYNPTFEPEEPGYITLTTHNRKADAINEAALGQLLGRTMLAEAEIDGDFFDTMFPTEKILKLKKGAQVMFVRNDISGEKRFFNGKIGTITSLNDDGTITVTFPDSQDSITVEKEEWENIRYSMNETDNKLEQKTIGTFKQFPIRLAWAITIHKSQGLTFEKAVIDAGESFAAGQVYVALSRCISLDKLVLKSVITPRSIHSDPVINAFSAQVVQTSGLVAILEEQKSIYAQNELLKVFDFEKIIFETEAWRQDVLLALGEQSETGKNVSALYKSLHDKLNALQSVSRKFKEQLQQIFNHPDHETQAKERATKAIHYYTEQFHVGILEPLSAYADTLRFRTKMKKILRRTDALLHLCSRKQNNLYGTSYLGEKLFLGEPIHTIKEKVSVKKEKGETFKDTEILWREGKTMEQIATIRGLAVSTVEGHIAKLILTGKIKVNEVLEHKKIEAIENVLYTTENDSLGAVKAKLGEAYSFSDIRFVVNAKKHGDK